MSGFSVTSAAVVSRGMRGLPAIRQSQDAPRRIDPSTASNGNAHRNWSSIAASMNGRPRAFSCRAAASANTCGIVSPPDAGTVPRCASTESIPSGTPLSFDACVRVYTVVIVRPSYSYSIYTEHRDDKQSKKFP
jgi:hypothetical protein